MELRHRLLILLVGLLEGGEILFILFELRLVFILWLLRGLWPFRRRGDLNSEAAALFERLFHERCGRAPVMVVLAVDDEDTDLVAGRGALQIGGGWRRQSGKREPKQNLAEHGIPLWGVNTKMHVSDLIIAEAGGKATNYAAELRRAPKSKSPGRVSGRSKEAATGERIRARLRKKQATKSKERVASAHRLSASPT